MSTGSLYIVATPIGNLKDITLRALEVLKSVDYILSEDTRDTDKMLRHYNIKASQLSYRDQNHKKMFPVILNLLKSGKNLALVSDSGTPLISDPGYKLIRNLVKEGINIISIPGPSSVISTLVPSGLPTDKFVFLGFLPRSKGKQKEILKNYGNLDATLIVFESPFRIKSFLETAHEALGDREVCIANDITKLYESFIRGSLSDILYNQFSEVSAKPKGEFVVLISKKDP